MTRVLSRTSLPRVINPSNISCLLLTRHSSESDQSQSIRLQHNGFVSFDHLISSCKDLVGYAPDEVRYVAWTSRYNEHYTWKPKFHLERSKGRESIRYQVPCNPTETILASKNWFGVSSGDHTYSILREMANELGNYCFSDPHFTFGWCAVSDEFEPYVRSFQIEEKLKQVCKYMADEFYFVNSTFEFIGREEDKLAVVFEPVACDSVDSEKYLRYDYHFKILWRKAASQMAYHRGVNFGYFTDHTGDIEFGEVGGKLVYQMRYMKPKYHITLGRASKGAESQFLPYCRKLEISIDPDTFYVSSGARCELNL